MVIEFDPDDVDLTDDPEYQALISRAGPANHTLWAEGAAALAKRAEMLDIDREMNRSWERAMEKLLLMELSDAEFTTQRMMRLKMWTRERKRRQHNLHFKYDPSRRNPRLVTRDTKRQLASTRERLTAIQLRLWARYPHLAPAGWTAEADTAHTTAEGPRQARSLPVAARTRPSRQMRDEAFLPAPTNNADETPPKPERLSMPFVPEYLSPALFDMIVRDTGLTDPARETDDEVLAAYTKAGMGGYPGEYMLATLRGRTPPPHPDDEEPVTL